MYGFYYFGTVEDFQDERYEFLQMEDDFNFVMEVEFNNDKEVRDRFSYFIYDTETGEYFGTTGFHLADSVYLIINPYLFEKHVEQNVVAVSYKGDEMAIEVDFEEEVIRTPLSPKRFICKLCIDHKTLSKAEEVFHHFKTELH